MPLEISRLSREYLFFDVVTPQDLTQSIAEVAFMPNPNEFPEEADWQDADIIDFGNKIAVRVLVGPGHAESYDLTPDTSIPVDYQTWVRITDNPERPVRRPGIVTVL